VSDAPRSKVKRKPATFCSAHGFEIPAAKGIEVYLFAGPAMLNVVRRYNLFFRGGVLPPDWGFGFWYRTASSVTDDKISALAVEFRAREIPCEVIGLEAGWQSHAYGILAMDKSTYPHCVTA